MRFFEVLTQVIGLLVRERRVTYRALKREFDLDDAFLDDLRAELIFAKRVARDEHGVVLVWTGGKSSNVHSASPILPQQMSSQVSADLSDSFTLPPLVTASPIPATGSTEAAPAVSLATRDETQPALTPVLSADGAASARSALEAERRQLSVMFCDLADSTRLAQLLDPEDLREVIRAYQATAAEVIHQFDGTIAQYLGDGLLVYFGWPVAHEDDASRAAHAGLGIVEAITTTLNPRLERDKGVQIAVRIGIHTGPVVVGAMGGDGRQEHLATRDTVNIASRLEGLAAPNTVVISSVTARLVRGAFALQDLGPHALKGVAEPMVIYRVLAPLERPVDEPTSVAVPLLVGREEEMGLLRRRWEQAQEGLGQVVLISGAAGIGKSSLVNSLRQHVGHNGVTRMTFRCSPYHTNSVLYPVVEHLQRVLRWQPDDTPDDKGAKLEQVLQTTRLPLEEAMPLFAALFAVPLPAQRYAPLTLSPQQQRQQTSDTLVAWLLEEAERHPVLAVWEDLHWADPSSLELLGLLIEQMPTVPMLQMLTFRPEFVPPWPIRSHLTPITLNRLERPQVEALITRLSSGKTMPSEVVEHIVAKTDGVPLYVEELTKMLLDSDLLQETPDPYTLTGPLQSVTIPDTLQDSLMARLDQLNTAKEFAQLGAVLGREFDYDRLRAIASQDEALIQTGLTQLVAAELLYQRGRPPRARYVFKHALIQDAAYASLLRSTRQRIHQQIADLLAAQFPVLVETQPELLAHHYTEAACHPQAVAYWQRAGQRAVQRSAYAEASHHLAQGLALHLTIR